MIFELRLIEKNPKTTESPLLGRPFGIVSAKNAEQAATKTGSKIIPAPEYFVRFANTLAAPAFSEMILAFTWIGSPDPRYYCVLAPVQEISTSKDFQEALRGAITLSEAMEERQARKYS